MEKTLLFTEYSRIIRNEAKTPDGFHNALIRLESPREILGIVAQLQSIVKSSTVLRCCATKYGLSQDSIAFESVSAHTNLVQTIVDRVLSYRYGPYFDKTEDGFTYREIMEVIRRHDLPENCTGDTPDDGARDEESKIKLERRYLSLFAKYSPLREYDFEKKIRKLQYEMEQKTGFCGKLLYLADKISAVLAVLGYDEMSIPPMMSDLDPALSEKDLLEMKICEDKTSVHVENGATTLYKASEMWTIDYFKIRKLYQYDSTGFITAILIMYTLIVRGKWYDWREEDYKKIN